jgi:carbon storage regulator CsrA
MDVLILARRIGQAIIIGDKEVIVKILDFQGGQVRLGIITKFPDLPVHREEVFDRVGANTLHPKSPEDTRE